MKYLEERTIGYQTPFATVPLVCTFCIFDLGIGSSDVRPDTQMAYNACLDAEKTLYAKELSALVQEQQLVNMTEHNT